MLAVPDSEQECAAVILGILSALLWSVTDKYIHNCHIVFCTFLLNSCTGYFSRYYIQKQNCVKRGFVLHLQNPSVSHVWCPLLMHLTLCLIGRWSTPVMWFCQSLWLSPSLRHISICYQSFCHLLICSDIWRKHEARYGFESLFIVIE